MHSKIVSGILWVILLACLFSVPALANDLDSLFGQVEKLRLERYGYVLGAALNPEQINTSLANPVEAVSQDTFKFKDKNLFIVARKKTHQVLILYEQVEDAGRQKIQDLIGDLYLAFGDPTVLAHDKVVYWAYGKKGKITSREFDAARQDKSKQNILATVKCVSDINITEKEKPPSKGRVYYIISSDPVLKFFKD